MRAILRIVGAFFRRMASLTVLALSIVVLGATTVIEGPQIYANYLRAVAESSVVLISISTGKDTGVQGTGFHVKTPSGRLVMLTNRHICEHSKNGTLEAASERDSAFSTRKILKISPITDLCMVEPIQGARPIPIASELLVGEKIVTAGHPSGLPLTIDYGQTIGVIMTSTGEELSDDDIKAGKCKWKNDKIVDEQDENGRQFKACQEFNRAILTTAQVVGGSSGSPLLNRYGMVVGAVFLKHVNDYAGAIPLRQLKEFLKGE